MEILVVRCLPGGNEEAIASGTIDLRKHFGSKFGTNSIEMTTTKKAEAQGSICKSFTYTAGITTSEPKHKQLFDTCC